jgi:hypothetical protein
MNKDFSNSEATRNTFNENILNNSTDSEEYRSAEDNSPIQTKVNTNMVALIQNRSIEMVPNTSHEEEIEEDECMILDASGRIDEKTHLESPLDINDKSKSNSLESEELHLNLSSDDGFICLSSDDSSDTTIQNSNHDSPLLSKSSSTPTPIDFTNQLKLETEQNEEQQELIDKPRIILKIIVPNPNEIQTELNESHDEK